MANLGLLLVVALLARQVHAGSRYTHGSTLQDTVHQPTNKRLLLSSTSSGDSKTAAIPNSSSSSSSTLTLEDSTMAPGPDDSYDVFSIFSSPGPQDSDASSSSTGSSDNSVGGDMFGSDWSLNADPMQQLYSSMTWSTYYPSSTGTEDDDMPTTGGSTATGSAADVIQESGQLNNTAEHVGVQSTPSSNVGLATLAVNTSESQDHLCATADTQASTGSEGSTRLPPQDTAATSLISSAAQGIVRAQMSGAEPADLSHQGYITGREDIMQNTSTGNNASITEVPDQVGADLLLLQQQSQHSSADSDSSKLYSVAPSSSSSSGGEGVHLGPGLITGVGVSLAGAVLAALAVIIWYKSTLEKMGKDSSRTTKTGVKSWSLPDKQHMPVVTAIACSPCVAAMSPIKSHAGQLNTAAHTVCVGPEPVLAPTAGVDLKWFTSCSSD